MSWRMNAVRAYRAAKPFLYGASMSAATAAGKHFGGVASRAASQAAYDKYQKGKKKGTKKKKTVKGRRNKKFTKNEVGSNQRLGKSVTYASHGTRQKGPPKVKVSKRFKQAVEKAIEPEKAYGTFDESFAGASAINPPDNAQYVGSVLTNAVMEWSFDVTKIANVAGVLYNGIGSGTPTNAYATSVLPNATNANWPIYDVGLKFKLKKCMTMYRFKNMNQTAVTLLCYLCKPKRVSSTAGNTQAIEKGFDKTGTLTAATPAFLTNPFEDWKKAVAADLTEQYLVQATPVTTLFNTPDKSMAFKRMYSMELTQVVLEPGQEWEWGFGGPSDLEIDFQRYYDDAYFYNIQKFSRCPLILVRGGLNMEVVSGASGGTGVPGRWNAFQSAVSGANVYGLAVERHDHYEIECPLAVYNSERVNRRSIAFYPRTAAATPVAVDREFENPIAMSAA